MYTYLYIYTYAYVHSYVCICIYIYMHIYMSIHMQCIFLCAWVFVYTFMSTYTHICKRIYTCILTYVYVHTSLWKVPNVMCYTLFSACMFIRAYIQGHLLALHTRMWPARCPKISTHTHEQSCQSQRYALSRRRHSKSNRRMPTAIALVQATVLAWQAVICRFGTPNGGEEAQNGHGHSQQHWHGISGARHGKTFRTEVFRTSRPRMNKNDYYIS